MYSKYPSYGRQSVRGGRSVMSGEQSCVEAEPSRRINGRFNEDADADADADAVQ